MALPARPSKVSPKKRLAKRTRRRKAMVELPAQRVEQVLEQRARALAVPLQPERPADQGIDAISFQLSRERYAIETRYVRQVMPLQTITPIPRTADFVVGLINVRGELIAVFDLRKFLDLAADVSLAPSHIIVIGDGQAEFAIVVEDLPRAETIPLEELNEVAQGTADRPPWLRGATGDALIVIDGSAFISDEKFFVESE
jgi:purine-binding chemotaxis protein CheW